jgi:hypothetical protein
MGAPCLKKEKAVFSTVAEHCRFWTP